MVLVSLQLDFYSVSGLDSLTLLSLISRCVFDLKSFLALVWNCFGVSDCTSWDFCFVVLTYVCFIISIAYLVDSVQKVWSPTHYSINNLINTKIKSRGKVISLYLEDQKTASHAFLNFFVSNTYISKTRLILHSKKEQSQVSWVKSISAIVSSIQSYQQRTWLQIFQGISKILRRVISLNSSENFCR